MSKPPYIIIDSSFLLRGVLHGENGDADIDAEEFLRRCQYLLDLGNSHLRVLPQMRREIEFKVARYTEEEPVQRGLETIGRIPLYPRTPTEKEDAFFRLFIEQMRKIGETLPRKEGKPGLSDADITYGAYCLLKTAKNDVIAATHDYLLMDTMYHIHKKAHPVFVSLGYRNSMLMFAEEISQLELRCNEINSIRAKRLHASLAARSYEEDRRTDEAFVEQAEDLIFL